MSEALKLSYGSHHHIERISDVRVNVLGPQVELVASIAPHPMLQSAPRPAATTLAIHMDQSVAMTLFGRLRETFRSMDWPLPLEDEPQA